MSGLIRSSVVDAKMAVICFPCSLVTNEQITLTRFPIQDLFYKKIY